MWQVLLAAAVAGSGIAAKRFLNTNSNSNSNSNPISVSDQTDPKCDQFEDQQRFDFDSSHPQFSIPHCEHYNADDTETESSAFGDTSIFRFSSSGSRVGSHNVRKRHGCGSRGIRRNPKGFNFKSVCVGNVENELVGLVDGFKGLAVNQRKSGKRFAFCLKKRRTSKNSTGKCDSCSSKDNSVFGCGLGIGMMYMMSAGKAEISKLNTAVDETAKVVQELKTELYGRKSLHTLRVSSSETEINNNSKKIGGKPIQQVLTKSVTGNGDDFEVSGLPLTEEGECSSSVLTEEPLPEVMEMDQLEAELESELQKLSWRSEEAFMLEGRSDKCEPEFSAKAFDDPEGQTPNSHQFNGVLPSELDQKLCHLLIEQQDSHVRDLESKLHQAHSKLHEKEAELQALKDCVKRLTEFSLATASDEETEAQMEEEKNSETGPDSTKSMVGMKRAMDFKSYSCYTK